MAIDGYTPAPLAPGSNNAIVDRGGTTSSGASVNTRPFEGPLDAAAEQNKLANRRHESKFQNVQGTAYIATVYSARIIPNSKEAIQANLSGHVYGFLFVVGSLHVLDPAYAILEITAAVDNIHSALEPPTEISSMMTLTDCMRVSRFHKFYSIVSDNRVPAPGDKLSVRYIDENPRTTGLIDKPVATLSVGSGGLDNPLNAFGPGGGVIVPLGAASAPLMKNGKIDTSNAIPIDKIGSCIVMKAGKCTGYSISRHNFNAWANSIGVSEDVLIMATVMMSEIGIKDESTFIVNTIINRVGSAHLVGRWAADSTRADKTSAWGVTIGKKKSTTGKQGSRPYSSQRPPKGRWLSLAVTRIVDILKSRLKNGDPTGGATYYVHNGFSAKHMCKGPPRNFSIKAKSTWCFNKVHASRIKELDWVQPTPRPAWLTDEHVKYYRRKTKLPDEGKIKAYIKRILGPHLQDPKPVAASDSKSSTTAT